LDRTQPHYQATVYQIDIVRPYSAAWSFAANYSSASFVHNVTLSHGAAMLRIRALPSR
jgi:hypothetical protein